MNKKIIAIVGIAGAIALSGGIWAASGAPPLFKSDKSDASSTSSKTDDAVNTDDSVPDDVSGSDIDEPTVPENTILSAQTPTVEPSVSYGEQLTAQRMTVEFAVDHTNGEQVSPRVVFGESYTDCFAEFNADGSFSMCINPSAGIIRTGTYQIYGDTVSVEYDDVGSEYKILTDAYGTIEYLIVNNGDYDVYFS